MGRFRIKISSSWFSKDYIILRYSTNGLFWKSVKEAEEDVLDEWYYMRTKTKGFGDAKYLLEKFNTLEKVRRYEAEQTHLVRKHNAEISERNRKHEEKRMNIYRQYG